MSLLKGFPLETIAGWKMVLFTLWLRQSVIEVWQRCDQSAVVNCGCCQWLPGPPTGAIFPVSPGWYRVPFYSQLSRCGTSTDCVTKQLPCPFKTLWPTTYPMNSGWPTPWNQPAIKRHPILLLAWLVDGDSLMCCIVMMGRHKSLSWIYGFLLKWTAVKVGLH